MVTLTRHKKETLKKEFRELKEQADSGYLPRQNHIIAKVNDLAMQVEQMPVSRGCGPCIVKDTQRILNALWNVKVAKKDD